MATRGFFRLINPEKNDGVDSYSGLTTDLIVEAYHDGYTEDMVEHFVRIPTREADMGWAGFGAQLFSKSAVLDGWGFGWSRNDPVGFHRTCVNSHLPTEYTWQSPFESLVMTKPYQFSIVGMGCDRYGVPIVESDLDFDCEVIEIEGASVIKLTFLPRVIEFYEQTDETLEETIQSIIDKHVEETGLTSTKPEFLPEENILLIPYSHAFQEYFFRKYIMSYTKTNFTYWHNGEEVPSMTKEFRDLETMFDMLRERCIILAEENEEGSLDSDCGLFTVEWKNEK